jgi:hypothetical protein
MGGHRALAKSAYNAPNSMWFDPVGSQGNRDSILLTFKWRRLPSQKLGRWQVAPPVLLQLDKDHRQLPHDLLYLLLVMN